MLLRIVVDTAVTARQRFYQAENPIRLQPSLIAGSYQLFSTLYCMKPTSILSILLIVVVYSSS